MVSTQPLLSYYLTHWVMWPAGMSQTHTYTQHAKEGLDFVLPLIAQVCFIADQHNNDITSSFCPHILNPLWRLLEGVHICSRRKKNNNKWTHRWRESGYELNWQRRKQREESKDWLTCDVIDNHSHGGVADVTGDEAPEALLTRSVPQLQPDLRVRERELRSPEVIREPWHAGLPSLTHTHPHYRRLDKKKKLLLCHSRLQFAKAWLK